MALQALDTSEFSESILDTLQIEYNQTKQQIKDNSVMLEQSQLELNRLIQRNTTFTGQLQQLQSTSDTMSREEIKAIYNNAIDAQQRLLVMRGQIDKLQNEQNLLERYLGFIEQARTYIMENVGGSKGSKSGDGMASLEELIGTAEGERGKLAKEMHDGPAQVLSNFVLQAEILEKTIDVDPTRVKDELASLKAASIATFQNVRNFVFELQPMSIGDLGLVSTLKKYTENFKDHNNVEVNFQMRGSERRLHNYLELMIFRAVQELMTNAVVHNQKQLSKLKIDLTLSIEDDRTKVTVADNGLGFDPATAITRENSGLSIIRKRAEMLGGRLDIDSVPAKGSMITLEIPCVPITAPSQA
jgi:two-component system, NarL family, sensor histidine kinase DegS